MRPLKKGIFFLIFLQLIAPVSLLMAKSGGPSEPMQWELITESFGIKVYERWIEPEPDLKVRERSGKMVLSCSMEDVIELISDYEKVPLWMNAAEKVEVLKRIDKKEWYQRTVLDAPWPFSKQDMVSHYIVKESKCKNKAQILILRETKLYPKQKGIERLDSFNAKWEVEKINDNKVKVTFTTSSTKPPEYPSWVQDPVVRNMFFSNLKNFKKLISEMQSS